MSDSKVYKRVEIPPLEAEYFKGTFELKGKGVGAGASKKDDSQSYYPSIEHVQVFMIGLNGYCYTAVVDLKRETVADLFGVVSRRSGISMAMLDKYFRFTMRGKLIIPHQNLESQGVERESTLKIEWRLFHFSDLECCICLENIDDMSQLRTTICRLSNGEYATHLKPYHYDCLNRIFEDKEGECPVCRGEIARASLLIP